MRAQLFPVVRRAVAYGYTKSHSFFPVCEEPWVTDIRKPQLRADKAGQGEAIFCKINDLINLICKFFMNFLKKLYKNY